MKRKWMIFVLLPLFFITNCNINCQVQPSDSRITMQFVKLVQKRYYYIQRLEKPIKVLLFLYEKLNVGKKHSYFNFIIHPSHSEIKKIIVKPGTALLFQHEIVRKCMREIEQTQTIDALKNLWNDFISYKFIESDSFIQETLKAVILLYKNIFFNAAIPNTIEKDHLIRADEVNSLLHDQEFEINDNFSCIVNLLDTIYEQKDFVINNNLRLYLINRLQKSIKILMRVDISFLPQKWDCLHLETCNNTFEFKHEAIVQCVIAIIESKSLHPLFGLWDKFSSYNYIDDSLFLKEFIHLQHIIYARLIACANHKEDKAPSPQEILDLYETISELPISEALNSLDILVEELLTFIEKYELDSHISWQTWLKKYWWVPPVIAFSLCYKLFIDKDARVVV